MVRRRASFAVGFALGLAVAWVAPTLCGPRRGRVLGSAPIQDRLAHHAEALQLDEQTIREAQVIADNARDELDAYRADVRRERSVLNRILAAREVDEERMREAVKMISVAEAKLRASELEAMLKIRRLLTAEQVDKLKRLGPPGVPGRSDRPPMRPREEQ